MCRARDTKLGREVAIKVIAPEFAHDEQRMARFQRAAQVLASLNHNHIASFYGFDDNAGVSALVMELVEGPTLGERIKEGAIPVDEALPIARQIAKPLECVHERGIIHRDVKPANISAVLFEMLTSKQAFGRETVSGSLAAVIKDTPDWTKLPAETPAVTHELIARCLQKDPKQRLQAIGDARIAIDDAISGASISRSSLLGSGISASEDRSRETAAQPRPAAALWVRWLTWLVAGALGVGLQMADLS